MKQIWVRVIVDGEPLYESKFQSETYEQAKFLCEVVCDSVEAATRVGEFTEPIHFKEYE